MSNNESKYKILKSEILNLIGEWEEQTKDFRQKSLDAADPIETARMRAKADTLNYRRGQLIVALEWAEENITNTDP